MLSSEINFGRFVSCVRRWTSYWSLQRFGFPSLVVYSGFFFFLQWMPFARHAIIVAMNLHILAYRRNLHVGMTTWGYSVERAISKSPVLCIHIYPEEFAFGHWALLPSITVDRKTGFSSLELIWCLRCMDSSVRVSIFGSLVGMTACVHETRTRCLEINHACMFYVSVFFLLEARGCWSTPVFGSRMLFFLSLARFVSCANYKSV